MKDIFLRLNRPPVHIHHVGKRLKRVEGYSDMAIGLGKMFGFDFMENFNYPYISTSIREFWRRWHISLSTWFREYLYIPLGGNRIDAILQGKHLMQDHFRIRQRIGAEEHPANHYNHRRIDVIQSPEAVLLQ